MHLPSKPMKTRLLISLLIFFAVNCRAQITFQRLIEMGNAGTTHTYAVLPTTDSGYVLTGYSDIVGWNNSDMFLIKTTSAGEVSWSRSFRDIMISAGYDVQQTADGGFIIAGSTYLADTTT